MAIGNAQGKQRARVSQGDKRPILLAIGSKTLQATHVRRLVKRWPLAARRDKRRDRCEALCEAPVSDSKT